MLRIGIRNFHAHVASTRHRLLQPNRICLQRGHHVAFALSNLRHGSAPLVDNIALLVALGRTVLLHDGYPGRTSAFRLRNPLRVAWSRCSIALKVLSEICVSVAGGSSRSTGGSVQADRFPGVACGDSSRESCSTAAGISCPTALSAASA